MKTWPTLLGIGDAAVIGLPESFSLTSALETAKEIRLATAFARRSGWKFFKDSIHNCNAKVFLLTGRDCYQTEPKLLKDWLLLKSKASPSVKAHLSTDETFFHPKVLIVSYEQSAQDFAVVGSGNLSKGGLNTNTECSMFINDAATVEAVANWFDIEFIRGLELNEKLISVYESDYEKYKDRRTWLTKQDVETGRKLKAAAEATMASWDEAVKAAKKYFASKPFQSSYINRQEGANKIKSVLKAPGFNFDKFGWHLFYTIAPVGAARREIPR